MFPFDDVIMICSYSTSNLCIDLCFSATQSDDTVQPDKEQHGLGFIRFRCILVQ